MEEKIDVYTRDGKYLGIKSKTECHSENPGFYHKPAWKWVPMDREYKDLVVEKFKEILAK